MSVRVQFNYLFALLILLLSYKVYTQTRIPENKIQFKSLTHQEGFTRTDISCIFQDDKGFLWMTSADWLIRFDGKKRKLFEYSATNIRSIGANPVKCIYQDKSYVLWFGTIGGGLNKYNSSEENFIRYTHNTVDSSSISANDVYAIYEDRNGIFWVGTFGGGLNKFDRRTGNFTCYKNIPDDITSLSNDNVTAIYEDCKGTLWIGTSGGGLNKFTRDLQKFTRYEFKEFNQNSLSNNSVTGICEDGIGNLWISTMGGGLNKLMYNQENGNYFFLHYTHNPDDPNSLSGNDIYKIYLDREKEFWIGTWGGGLNKMITNLKDSSTVTFVSYKHNPLDIFSLRNNNVADIYEDNSGVLWISSWGAGLQIYDKNKKQFRLYENEPNNPNSLSSTAVWSVFEDREGFIWVGTGDGGLNKMVKGSNKFIHYKHNQSNPYSLSDNCVSAIYEDKFNSLWVGTWNGGLNQFDRKTGRFYRFKHDSNNPKSISDDRIYALMGDPAGNLWIGTYSGGLNRFNRTDESFTHYTHNPDDPGSISSDFMINLFSNKSGDLFIATKKGLDTFDSKNKKFIHYDLTGNNSPLIEDIKVTSVFQSKSSILWIGTKEIGLIKYDPDEGQKKIYTINDGLPVNYITGILEDDYGNIWVSTTIGVSKFNPLIESIKTYTYEDGIQGIGEMTPCKSRTGEMIFGSSMGLSIFHPDSIRDYSHIPIVYFTDLYLFNKKVPIGYDSLTDRTILNKSLIECNEIVLNYDDNVLSFEFSIIDFHSLFKGNQFAYMMKGFDKDWIYSNDDKRTVTYTNLDPGEYTLRVKAANNDNIWNEKGASLRVMILPPWWKTVWAYIFYFLFIAISIYIIWNVQLRRLRAKQELEISKFQAQKMLEVDEMKSRFFTNISHEFRTPLTLILGPVKQALDRIKDENTRDELSVAHKNANKLLRLVNQLLDISKLESGNMKLWTRPINFVELLKAHTVSFAFYAERKRITLDFNSNEDKIIVYTDKDKIEKIFTNILSNAFKFTPEGGKVEVTLVKDNSFINTVISDTGIGISKEKLSKIFDRFYQVDGSHTREQEGTGIGLALTKELVELHKGKIEVESEESKGTTFTVSIPLGKEHLKTEEINEGKELEFYEHKEDIILLELDQGKEKKQKLDLEFLANESLPLLLIIEDNLDVRKYIKDNLMNEFRTIEAIDGEEGWNKSIEHMPDLIVSDVMMPKMDGFKLCEKLKTDERTSHIPIILLTAKAAKEDKLEGYKLGADEYLMKPFEPVELKARIKNLIEQRKRLQDHFRKQGIEGIEHQKITSFDKRFLQKLFDVIKNKLSDSEFSVEFLAENLAISRSVLQRKVYSLTGESPVELIRRIRLNRASELIENKFGNISEIAFEVGFSNPAYFADCFKNQYGITPTQYQRRNKTS